MNKINFYSGDKFPLFREALDKMQDMLLATASLALLGGDNYILSGCGEDADGNIADGMVVITGELLPFAGGPKGARVAIEETRQDVTAFNVVYPETYIARTAKFDNSGDHLWADFARTQTLGSLYNMIRNITGDAPGMIKEWAGLPSKVPVDYMICDGRELQIGEYPQLYDNIGVTYGGDGITTFRIPNDGGRVAVGYTGSGDYARLGNTFGKETHTLTVDEIPEHDHTVNGTFNKLSAKASDIDEQASPGSIDANSAQAEYNVGSMNPDRWEQATIRKVGSGNPHENRQPSIVRVKIIKVR